MLEQSNGNTVKAEYVHGEQADGPRKRPFLAGNPALEAKTKALYTSYVVTCSWVILDTGVV